MFSRRHIAQAHSTQLNSTQQDWTK